MSPKTMTPEIERLLTDFTEQRDQLKQMIKDLDVIKVKLDALFPDQLTARNRYFFDEKVKTASAMFSSLLEIRKEIIKSIRDEIELRRKFELEERDLEETDDDIRRLASKIEQLSGVKLTVIEAFKQPKEESIQEAKRPEDDSYVDLKKLSLEVSKEEEANG